MNPRSLLVLAAACWLCPAAALLTRPDRDDAEYLELASRYSSSIHLGAQGGEGVLIAPRWVLTTPARARPMQLARPAARLAIGGRDHEVESVFVQGEVALILLRTDVRGVAATPIYRGADEAGKTVVIAAHGPTGRIGSAPAPADGRKRAAINTIDRVAPRTFGMRIKAGDEASDLQGALVAGEDGAPAFIDSPGGLFVAGIHQAAEGEWENYARASAFAKWIDDTMLEVAAREAAELLGDPGS